MLPSCLLPVCGGSGGSRELQHCAGRQWKVQKGDTDWTFFFYEKSNKKNFLGSPVDPPTVKRMLPTNEKNKQGGGGGGERSKQEWQPGVR